MARILENGPNIDPKWYMEVKFVRTLMEPYYPLGLFLGPFASILVIEIPLYRQSPIGSKIAWVSTRLILMGDVT